VHKDIRAAYDGNLCDYQDTIPELFVHNAVIVLSNGSEARAGTITSRFDHFQEWKRLAEESPGEVDFATLLTGMCGKANFMDLFENFILFDDTTGQTAKILARNHQFLGVNRAVEAVRHRRTRNGQLGVFWHTQGSGKSYSMVFFSRKVHCKLTGNFTFLIVTDREDLDRQIYKTFAGCGIVDNERDRCRAASGENLEDILTQDKPYVFTMIHKFHREVDPAAPYSTRDDIIVISDEAHRTQYGRLALNMRNALPHASYIGFTGTPLFTSDEITRRIFGDYISTYDFKRAVEDAATVPLYYDNRGEKLKLTTTDLNEQIAEKLEAIELDPNQQARLERELAREYHIITAEKRLDAIAADFVQHYTRRWETGKAMLVCIDKITTVRMYHLIQKYWAEAVKEAETAVARAADEQEAVWQKRRLQWLNDTITAVVVSEEQNEVKRFAEWDLDITPHRQLIKSGFETQDGKRIDVDTAFKKPEHPFRVAIICAMWLTGFDVPSLSTLYLDKPLKAHTLMQAIARANRVYEEKNNGLIVDYCGILKNLRKALATFAVGPEGGPGGIDPVKPEEDLVAELSEAVNMIRSYLTAQGAPLENVEDRTGFERIAAINRAKEAVNENDETRKRFEILAREVFKKFKACLTIPAASEYRPAYAAVDIIYKRLQEDREKADINGIIKELHALVDEAVDLSVASEPEEEDRIYDISQINFDRLKEEFKKSKNRHTTVQNLKAAVEKRLDDMIRKNPLRMDFNQRYQTIIDEYNREKDRLTIEQTFEKIVDFIDQMNAEERRAVREGLDEEHLALFDILTSGKTLDQRTRNRIKQVASELLAAQVFDHIYQQYPGADRHVYA